MRMLERRSHPETPRWRPLAAMHGVNVMRWWWMAGAGKVRPMQMTHMVVSTRVWNPAVLGIRPRCCGWVARHGRMGDCAAWLAWGGRHRQASSAAVLSGLHQRHSVNHRRMLRHRPVSRLLMRR